MPFWNRDPYRPPERNHKPEEQSLNANKILYPGQKSTTDNTSRSNDTSQVYDGKPPSYKEATGSDKSGNGSFK